MARGLATEPNGAGWKITLSAMRYGVQMARRGWIEKKDVINTLPVEKLLSALRTERGEGANGKHQAAAASGGREKGKARKSG